MLVRLVFVIGVLLGQNATAASADCFDYYKNTNGTISVKDADSVGYDYVIPLNESVQDYFDKAPDKGEICLKGSYRVGWDTTYFAYWAGPKRE